MRLTFSDAPVQPKMCEAMLTSAPQEFLGGHQVSCESFVDKNATNHCTTLAKCIDLKKINNSLHFILSNISEIKYTSIKVKVKTRIQTSRSHLQVNLKIPL